MFDGGDQTPRRVEFGIAATLLGHRRVVASSSDRQPTSSATTPVRSGH